MTTFDELYTIIRHPSGVREQRRRPPAIIRCGQIVRVGYDHAIYYARYLGGTRQARPGDTLRVVVHGQVTDDLPFRPLAPASC